MLTYRALYIFLFLQYNLSMYPDYVDSVKQIINNHSGNKAEVDALNGLAGGYYYSESDSLEMLATRALNLADSLQYTKGLAYALHHLGASNVARGEYTIGLKHYKRSLFYKRLMSDSGAIAGTLNNMGLIYYELGNYSQALAHYQESLSIKFAMKDSIRIARTLNNIGEVFQEQNDFDKSLSYYERALEIRRLIGDLRGQQSSLSNIGECYLEKNDFVVALDYLMQSYSLLESFDEQCNGQNVTHNLGEVYFKLGDLDHAEKQFQKVYDLGETCNEPLAKILGLSGLGRVYQQKGFVDQAMTELVEAYELATKHQLKEEVKKLSRNLYKLHKSQNNLKSALHYLEEAERLEKELFNKDLTEKLTRMELNYEFEQERDSLKYQKNAELLTMNVQLQGQRRLQYYMLIGLIVAIGFGVVIFRANRINQKARLELKNKNEVISSALNEREVLLKEIHHRVKNNLQVVSSLLNIQSKYLNDELAKKAVVEGRNRVLSMALVHEKLYQSDDLSNVDVREYLEQLAVQLFRSYNVSDDRIKLNCDIKKATLSLDETIQIGLIINELVSNALKYAFPDQRTGVVKISLRESNGQHELEVADDGIGLSSEEDLSKSYGYRIVMSIIRGLDGEFFVNLNGGTSFRLIF